MNRRRKTILLVEDNEDTRFVLSAILNHDGYHVVEAMDGAEGVSRAREDQPDLILMDIRMPRMDGFEAGEAIRRDARISEIPIVAVTAEYFDARREERARVLFHCVLSKPVEPEGLRARIRGIIGDP